jgi:arylsulfatase A-like enzyme
MVIYYLHLSILLNISYAQPKDGVTPASNYNLIVISLDALRADHLGCYGYFRDTSPNIDKMAEAGVLFEWAISQASFTLPSMVSLFTSKYVRSHKVDRVERWLPDREVTLAEVLRENGYRTGAFIYNAVQFDPSFGLSQGFETYHYGYEAGEEIERKESFEKSLPVALSWIGRHKQEKFFVFLHANDIHTPYHSPLEDYFDPSYRGRLDNEYFSYGSGFHKRNFARTHREIEHIIAHYDGGIRYVDSFVGRLMHKIDEWDLRDKTIIILLADHGEILADRGMRFCHGFSLHDEELHVPLIILHPGLKKQGVRIAHQVQLIDVMPTILDFLKIDTDNLNMEGKSLIKLIEAKEKDFNRYVFAECLKGESEKQGILNRQVMVRTPSWKLISSTWDIRQDLKEKLPTTVQLHNTAIISLPQEDEFQLYDLKADPGESRNLIDDPSTLRVQAELLAELLATF